MRMCKMAAAIDETQVMKAFLALQQYEQKKSKRPNLTAENGLIWAMVALTKIPQGTKRPVRISLPHSLHGETSDSDVCLITKDPKKNAKERLLRSEVTFIKKVIPLDKLKTEFKSFESRRQLCSSFDVFLADSSIYHRLHSLLGKSFYARKKFPLPVNMKKDLKAELEAVLSSTHFNLGLGSCVSIPISRLNFTPKQGNENVQAIVKGLPRRLPGGWPTVQSVHLKTVDSVALPIHKTLPKPPMTVAIGGYSRRIERKRAHMDEPDITSTTEADSTTPSTPCQKRTKPDATAARRKRQIGTASLTRIRGSRVRKAISVQPSN